MQLDNQFVFSQHCKAARKHGVPEEQIKAITHWQVSEVFDANRTSCFSLGRRPYI